MKKTTGRFLSLLLAAALLLAVLPMSGVHTEADAKTYKTGDIITFGGYPQTRVTDSKTISALNKLQKQWISYKYRWGDGTTLEGMSDVTYIKAGDYMRYADVSYQGAVYRAVVFDKYRPNGVWIPTDTSGRYSFQDDNGYACNTVYYFRFEPLRWRVLDPNSGLVLCQSIIDAQPFQNMFYRGTGKLGYSLYQDAAMTTLAHDYGTASIRQWLKNDFYNTAFSATEQSKIGISEFGCVVGFNNYETEVLKDRIFLLSSDEADKSAYGFDDSASGLQAKIASGTDYAGCQGLGTNGEGKADWWLRTSSTVFPDMANVMLNMGWVMHSYCASTSDGVRPAFRFKSGIAADNNPLGGHAVPVVPGDVDGNGKVESADARLALRAAVGLEKYAKGSVKFRAADATKDGKITAEDARLILRAAVGLEKLK